MPEDAYPEDVQPGSVQPGSVQPGSVQPGSVQSSNVHLDSVHLDSVYLDSVYLDSVYLDNAATTFPKPGAALRTAMRFYSENGVNPGRTGCELALEAERMVIRARRGLSAFFNPSLTERGVEKDYRRLAFTMNATMALNLVINGTLRAGDHVVTSVLEHNSVIRPVNHKVRDGGVEATYVAPDDEGYLDPEDIRRAIRPNTRLCILDHASNVTGVVQDLAAIGTVCREAGVPLAVDAAQSAGVIDIDMAAWGVSFLIFTGHKALMGPSGTGGVCVADDAEIEGTIYGGTGVDSAMPYHSTAFPYRLEAGTLDLLGIAGLVAGLEWIQGRGLAEIRRHELALLARLQDGLAEIPGVRFLGTRRLDRRIAVLSITVDNWDPEDVGTILDCDYGVQTRTGLHCAPLIHRHHGTGERGAVRFSLGPFNTCEHIDRAVRAVAEIARDRNAS
ncbi:MAG: aminotransferase class V-fold PLP-dependent enzyme [Planctomycetes bacterium]|nr:aminotransferase class V-fold PLP-dependent enzyme [Planctomycetota bacterium]